MTEENEFAALVAKIIKNDLPEILSGDHSGVLEWLKGYNAFVREYIDTEIDLHLERVVNAFEKAGYTFEAKDNEILCSDDQARYIIAVVLDRLLDGGHNMLFDDVFKQEIAEYNQWLDGERVFEEAMRSEP